MKKNLGTSTGVLALLAVALHLLNAPVADKPGNPEAQPTTGVQTPGTQGGASPAAPEKLIEGPWLATQTFFHQTANNSFCFAGSAAEKNQNTACQTVDLSNIAELETCSTEDACRKQLSSYFALPDYHIQYLIASVPDPLHTRLSLFTDTAIEAIEQAAFDSHWEFASQWLPWRDNADPAEKNPENRRKQRLEIQIQEEQPGVLVFRHTAVRSPKQGYNFDDQVLMIFLVGETPTAGVNGLQFRAARAYMRAFDGSAPVRIAGPVFSGSFYSLTQLIRDDRARRGVTDPARTTTAPDYLVLSGTATNTENAEAFKKESGAEFHGFSENSDDQDRRFQDILASLHIPANQAAILVEDESGFSKGYSKRYAPSKSRHVDEPHVFRFPREISHLRNIYRDVTAPARPQTSTLPEVEFSLKDPDSGEDSVPAFSSTQTPLSQNAVVGEIIGEIRRDRIRIVELAATNVLDSVFLAGILKRQCPDTRTLIMFPDLLFVQATQVESLVGTLALSSYPLFFGHKEWLGEHVVHASTNAAGLYNALLYFLLPHDLYWILHDYSWNRQDHPSAWLMTLDRQGFSPLKLLPPLPGNWFVRVKAPRNVQFRLPPPPLAWSITTDAMAVFSLAACCWILYLDRHALVLSWAIPAPDGCHIADAYRLWHLIGALLTLSAMQWVLYIPFAGDYFSSFEQHVSEGQSVHIFSFLGALFPVVIAIWLLPRVFNKPRNASIRKVYVGGVLLFFAGLLAAWSYCCLRPEDQAGFFFSFRALELRTGSSPALPVLFLLFGLYLFFNCHLIRFYFAINQRPRLFSAVLDQFFKGQMRNCRRELNRALVAPMNLTPRQQAVMAAIAVAALAIFSSLCRADIALGTADGRLFDGVVISLAMILVIAIVATTVQMRISWSALQSLLVRLNLLPLGAAFTRLRDAGSNGPIWARRLNLQSLDIPTRSSIVLHNLHVLQEAHSPDLNVLREDYWATVSGLIGERQNSPAAAVGKKNKLERMDRASQRKAFCHLRYLSAFISDEVLRGFLLPEWKKRLLPWSGSAAVPEKGETPQEGESGKPDRYDLAQTFVTLQFSMFINYGVRQIQNLILAISLGFGFLVVALNVYSFQSPRMIGRFFLGGFAVLSFICWKVMSQIERDPILSRLSGTTEGELNKEFYLRLVGYGALPVLGLLTSMFPTIGHFISSWIEPSLEALR